MVVIELAVFAVMTSIYLATQCYFCRHPEIPNGVHNIIQDDGDAWKYAMYNKYTVW